MDTPEFNDPFDCNLHVVLIAAPEVQQRRLRQLNPDKSEAEIAAMVAAESSPNALEKKKEDIRIGMHDAQRNVGIFTMSARRDHILMWSHYADSHRGLCPEFAVSDTTLFGCSLTRVIYQKEYPQFNIYDEIDQQWVSNYLATKSHHWSYEEEWRIFYHTSGVQLFPDSELTGVILGARISQEDRQMIWDGLRAHRYPIQVYEAREKDTGFGLDIIHLGETPGLDVH